jgi:hypothetical protein
MNRALTELLQRLLAAEENYLQQQEARTSVVFQSVLDDDQITELVVERLAEISQSALDGIGFTLDRETGLTLLYHGQNRGLDRWFLVSAEGVERHLNYCEQFWQYLDEECSVEGYLCSQGREINSLIDGLEQRATPWVAVNRAKQIPAEGQLLLLGTETGPQFVPNPPAHINVVATGDKTRLVLLYTIHGLDVMNLEQTLAWRDAYDQAIAKGKRLHVVPEVDPLNSANEKNGKKVKKGKRNVRKKSRQ